SPTLQKLLTQGIEFDQPLPVKIIDAAQREILSAIVVASAPVHVIHGLAGCGKSMLLQCLVAICAAHDYRLSDADRGAETILLTFQVLRHEFLQGLLHNATS
ncbi:MAG: hypothetical protein ACKPKO_48255, partial [Candidatus Fonsibacter sp.]